MPMTLIPKWQFGPLNILDTDVAASAAITSSKLADGADFLKRDGSVALAANFNAGGFALSNLAAPTGPNDAVRLADLNNLSIRSQLSAGTGLSYSSATGIFGLNATTDNVGEGTANKYFTNARVLAALSAGTGLAYNNSTGMFSLNTTTDGITEGSSNLYFNNTRVRAAIGAGTGLNYNASTGMYTLNASTDTISEGSINKYFTAARSQSAISASGNEIAYNPATGVISKNKTVQTLADGPTVTFNVTGGYNAQLTLGASRTLAFANTNAGEYYTLKVIQDSSGNHALTLPAGCKVIGAGGGGVTLTAAANATDILTFFYDGTNYFVNYGLNYN